MTQSDAWPPRRAIPRRSIMAHFINPAKTATKKRNSIRTERMESGHLGAGGGGEGQEGTQACSDGSGRGWTPGGEPWLEGQGPEAASAAPGGALAGARRGWAVLLGDGRAPRQGWVAWSQVQLSPVLRTWTPGWPGTGGSQDPRAALALTPLWPLLGGPRSPRGSADLPPPGATGVLPLEAAQALVSCPPSGRGPWLGWSQKSILLM